MWQIDIGTSHNGNKVAGVSDQAIRLRTGIYCENRLKLRRKADDTENEIVKTEQSWMIKFTDQLGKSPDRQIQKRLSPSRQPVAQSVQKGVHDMVHDSTNHTKVLAAKRETNQRDSIQIPAGFMGINARIP